MMDDLFSAAWTSPSNAVSVSVNNDVVPVGFQVVGAEQVAHGRVAKVRAMLVSLRLCRRDLSAVRGGRADKRLDPQAAASARPRHETERVGHAGVFAGEHGKYKLVSPVEVIELVRADDMRARKRKSGRESRYAAL